MTPFEFVKRLAAVSLPNVFNPYSDICDIHDVTDAPDIRKDNLLRLLKAVKLESVSTMWVGRDLGYMGGRRTGVALTDEMRLPTYSARFESLTLRRSTIGAAIGERTAGVTWDMLQQLDAPVMLWNAFPLHPHEPGRPLTNRCHTRKERTACKPLFSALIDLIAPKMIIAIGNDAADALADFGAGAYRVRHPSYGGKTDFVDGIQKLYKLKQGAGSQHELQF